MARSEPQLPFDLETEMREGVPHFKRGQHRAFVGTDEPDAAILIYVGNMGWAVVLPCERRGAAGWQHCGIALSVSCNGPRTGWRKIREAFVLNADMIAALDAPTVLDDEGLVGATAEGRTVVDR